MNNAQKWVLFLIVCGLFLLIGIAAILTEIGYFEKADPNFRKFALAVLFTDIGGAVVATFLFAFGGSRHIVINLTFATARPDKIKPKMGEFEAFDRKEKRIASGKLAILKGKAGWVGKFEISASEVDHVRLSVTDAAGRVWKSEAAVALGEFDSTLE